MKKKAANNKKNKGFLKQKRKEIVNVSNAKSSTTKKKQPAKRKGNVFFKRNSKTIAKLSKANSKR